jgi:RNA polymerase sigma-70 factor (ECF subfamily)
VASDAIGLSTMSHVEGAPAEGRIAALFDAHHRRLYRLARRMAPNRDAAMDLVQETFLRAARSPSSVPPGAASEEAWLVRVLINVCRDGWRRDATVRRTHGRGALDAPSRATSSPEAALIAHDAIWSALRRLSPRRRAVIVLHELEDLPVAAISKTLGISRVTVRWHLSTGRRDLARIIGKERARG